jgi:hypothetical protein
LKSEGIKDAVKVHAIGKAVVVLELDPIPLCVPGPCLGELVIRVVDEHHRVNPLAKGTVGREDNFEIEVFREGVQRVGLGRC